MEGFTCKVDRPTTDNTLATSYYLHTTIRQQLTIALAALAMISYPLPRTYQAVLVTIHQPATAHYPRSNYPLSATL